MGFIAIIIIKGPCNSILWCVLCCVCICGCMSSWDRVKLQWLSINSQHTAVTSGKLLNVVCYSMDFSLYVWCVVSVCARMCLIRLWIVIEASSHPSQTEGGKPVREIKSHERTKPINTLFLSQLTIIFLHLFISFSFSPFSEVYHCLGNHSNSFFPFISILF